MSWERGGGADLSRRPDADGSEALWGAASLSIPRGKGGFRVPFGPRAPLGTSACAQRTSARLSPAGRGPVRSAAPRGMLAPATALRVGATLRLGRGTAPARGDAGVVPGEWCDAGGCGLPGLAAGGLPGAAWLSEPRTMQQGQKTVSAWSVAGSRRWERCCSVLLAPGRV